MKRFLILILILSISLSVQAKVTLPALLASNAVLQQKSNLLLWGEATGRVVIIKPSWTDKEYKADVKRDNSWSIMVETPNASNKSYSISFSDGETTTIENILIGEVWFCSGQSNMKVPVKGNVSQPVLGSTDAIYSAKKSIPLRLYTVDETYAFTPQKNSGGKWEQYTSESVAAYGATPFFFGRYLQQILDVPVGIVNCSWGGSKIESWLPREVLESYKEYDFSMLENEEVSELPQTDKVLLYNGMMHSMKNLCFKGMLWYQGEANRVNYWEYPELFSLFTDMLRTHFNCGKFPIYYAQIAPFGFGPENYGALMRESMTKIMDKVEKTGMITLSDIGEEVCIHPRYKEITGKRFAYWALGNTYGYKGVEYRAPEYRDMKEVSATDNLPIRVALRFNYAEMGLCFINSNTSNNFEVAGEDGIFYPAEVRLVTKAEYPIELWSNKVHKIIAVRYGFKNYFKGDVFNNFGIPLSSFRTDKWQIK